MPQQKVSRLRIQWYSDADTPEERQKIRKIDLLIVPVRYLGAISLVLVVSGVSRHVCALQTQ